MVKKQTRKNTLKNPVVSKSTSSRKRTKRSAPKKMKNPAHNKVKHSVNKKTSKHHSKKLVSKGSKKPVSKKVKRYNKNKKTKTRRQLKKRKLTKKQMKGGYNPSLLKLLEENNLTENEDYELEKHEDRGYHILLNSKVKTFARQANGPSEYGKKISNADDTINKFKSLIDGTSEQITKSQENFDKYLSNLITDDFKEKEQRPFGLINQLETYEGYQLVMSIRVIQAYTGKTIGTLFLLIGGKTEKTMVLSDPDCYIYSAFLRKNIKFELEGKLGIYIDDFNGTNPYVNVVDPTGEAASNGVKPGMKVISIDDKDVSKMNASEVTSMIKTKSESSFKIEFYDTTTTKAVTNFYPNTSVPTNLTNLLSDLRSNIGPIYSKKVFEKKKLIKIKQVEKEVVGVKKYQKPIFGAADIKAANNNQNGIPSAVIYLVSHLSAKKCLENTGIFRIPGNADRMKTINKNLFKKQYNITISTDPAALASVLKKYYRDLKSKLIPYPSKRPKLETLMDKHTTELKCEVKNRSPPNVDTKLINNPNFTKELRNYLVTHMDGNSLTNLHFLLNFLNKVMDNNKINEMTGASISTCWGPTLFAQPEDQLKGMVVNKHALCIIEYMVLYVKEIFEGVVKEDYNLKSITEAQEQVDKNVKIFNEATATGIAAAKAAATPAKAEEAEAKVWTAAITEAAEAPTTEGEVSAPGKIDPKWYKEGVSKDTAIEKMGEIIGINTNFVVTNATTKIMTTNSKHEYTIYVSINGALEKYVINKNNGYYITAGTVIKSTLADLIEHYCNNDIETGVRLTIENIYDMPPPGMRSSTAQVVKQTPPSSRKKGTVYFDANIGDDGDPTVPAEVPVEDPYSVVSAKLPIGVDDITSKSYYSENVDNDLLKKKSSNTFLVSKPVTERDTKPARKHIYTIYVVDNQDFDEGTIYKYHIYYRLTNSVIVYYIKNIKENEERIKTKKDSIDELIAHYKVNSLGDNNIMLGKEYVSEEDEEDEFEF